MNLSELKEKLLHMEIFPIHVLDEANPEEAKGLSFADDFDGYINAIKSLNKKHIFIATEELGEEDFVYALRGDRVFDEDTEEYHYETQEVDVSIVNPDLKRFKEKIGEVGMFKLFTSPLEDNLNFYLHENWWLEYVSLYVSAIEHIKNNVKETQEKLKLAKKEKAKLLIKSLRELKNDQEFLSLRTQRAMTAYAKEKIAELDDVDPKILRQEIQSLHDKIS